MQFEKSEVEERYNNYWNEHIVRLDKVIKCISLGFAPTPDPSACIEQYKINLAHMINSLNKDTPKFDDKEYVQAYITTSLKQAAKDFSFYATIFPEYMDNCLRYTLDLEELISKREGLNPFRLFSHSEAHLSESSQELPPEASISPIL